MYSSQRTKACKRKDLVIIDKDDLNKFSTVEKQFLKWIQFWERRIFIGNQSMQHLKGNYLICNINKKDKIETYLKSYQKSNLNVLGQDRFVWTVFAEALIKKHKLNLHKKYMCSTKLCLLLLLWVSFYLNVSNSSLTKELMKEVLVCTGNLKFIFSFLPGMSMTSYIKHFVKENCDEDILCEEFFLNIDEDACNDNCGLYRSYSPLIHYFIKHLKSFQDSGPGFKNSSKGCNSKRILVSYLNDTLDDQNKHSLLTLAIKFRDEALVRHLLQLGASPAIMIWDPALEEYLSAEQLMITSINSLIASKHFFSSLPDCLHTTVPSITEEVESVSAYGRMMRRALLIPSSRKADNVWRCDSWRQELNSEIADKWGVGYKRSFPSLQHITKITIRYHILQNDNKILPDAISELPLPNMLKSYLNLVLD